MQDISDILEDLNRSHACFGDEDYDDGRPSGQADLQALTRAWVNERGTVELLPYLPLPFHTLTSLIVLQVAEWWFNRTRHGTNKGANRESRRADGQHGTKDEFQSYHYPNRSRAVEIPHSILTTRSNRED
jgi:hypothetical protein